MIKKIKKQIFAVIAILLMCINYIPYIKLNWGFINGWISLSKLGNGCSMMSSFTEVFSQCWFADWIHFLVFYTMWIMILISIYQNRVFLKKNIDRIMNKTLGEEKTKEIKKKVKTLKNKSSKKINNMLSEKDETKELEKLHKLKEKGIITEKDFEQKKKEILKL